MPLLITRLFLSTFTFFLLAGSSIGAELTLAWDPPSGPAPQGYRVRFGVSPGPATSERDLGTATRATITALEPGRTCEFHVVSYDTTGQVSGPSNVLRITIPEPLPLPSAPLPAAPPPPPPAEPTTETPAPVPAPTAPAPEPLPPPTVPLPSAFTSEQFPWFGPQGRAPEAPRALYLAEGVRSDTFETRLSVTNPSRRETTATVYLRPEGGRSYGLRLRMPPMSHADLGAAAALGDRTGAFGMAVESAEPLAVARTTMWHGGQGGHAETATPSPSTRWYFAEGATYGRFDLFYLLFNPGQDDAWVSISYLTRLGRPIVRRHLVRSGERLSIWVDQEAPELAATEVGAVIQSATGQPIVAERVVYLAGTEQYSGGHAGLGIPEARTHWYMVEGATGPFFDYHLVLLNPSPASASVRLRFHRDDGTVVTRDLTLEALRRTKLDVSRLDPSLADATVWTEVISTNNVPVVAERVMWWPGPSWQDGHVAAAAASPGARWLAPAGETGGPLNHSTFVLSANTSTRLQATRVTVLGPSGALARTVVQVRAGSRYTVDMADVFRQIEGRYSVLVEALGGEGQLIVEQTVYWDVGGQPWGAGTASPGVMLE